MFTSGGLVKYTQASATTLDVLAEWIHIAKKENDFLIPFAIYYSKGAYYIVYDIYNAKVPTVYDTILSLYHYLDYWVLYFFTCIKDYFVSFRLCS